MLMHIFGMAEHYDYYLHVVVEYARLCSMVKCVSTVCSVLHFSIIHVSLMAFSVT